MRGIELLSRPEDELETAIPLASQSAAENSQRSPAAAQLRLLMTQVLLCVLSSNFQKTFFNCCTVKQVDDLKSEREVLEYELKSATVDMKATFLGALAHDGAINEPAMSVEKLGEIYGPLQKRIRESLEFQANLIQQIQASVYWLHSPCKYCA